jgi:flagellar biosynthetic protein FliQ
MPGTELLELVRHSLVVGGLVLLPVLMAGFVVGTVVGLVQAATGLHEPIVGLVPRVAAMAFTLLLLFPWMLEQLVDLLRGALAGP